MRALDGHHYHIFNRGAHEYPVFASDDDYKRFQILLYLLNTHSPVTVRNVLARYQETKVERVFIDEYCDQSLVDILAYTLLPNHFHLVLREKAEDGVALFMQKVCTAYSMYFNTMHDHRGTLWEGRYKSRPIANESYLKYIFAYVHLNVLDLKENRRKDFGIKDTRASRAFVASYPYSSYYDYYVGGRPERVILCATNLRDFLRQNDFEELAAWQSAGRAEV